MPENSLVSRFGSLCVPFFSLVIIRKLTYGPWREEERTNEIETFAEYGAPFFCSSLTVRSHFDLNIYEAPLKFSDQCSNKTLPFMHQFHLGVDCTTYISVIPR